MKVILIYFSLILINDLFAQTNLNIDQIDTTWWYDNYSSGLKYLDNNELDAAEGEFRKILAIDEDIAHAYYGLGRIYDKLERGNEEAIENFQEAIDLNPDLVEAYYYLGLIYEYLITEEFKYRKMARNCFYTVTKKDPHFIDGWIARARWEEKYSWSPSQKPAEIFAEALRFNPEDKNLYELYKYSVFWHSQEDNSIPTFKYLIKQYPSISDYAIDFAQVLYNLDMYESSLNVLDSIEISYSNYSRCKVNLLRSKILFNTEKEDKGLDYYWQAINAISDSLDANEIYSDICYIINNSEFEEYQSISTTDLPDFYARFWLSRDPNLATKDNERIAEHFKRLKYARKNYRRYVSGKYEDAFFIYESDNRIAGINHKIGDELLNPLVSKALPANRALDDMGLIYLRHGEPDNTVFEVCEGCPQNLSWQYFGRNDRQEIIFHFVTHGGSRGWLLESLPSIFSNRWEFGSLYAQLDPTINPNQDIQYNISMYEILNDQNIENAALGVQTETTEYVYENTLFEFPLEYLCFKDENFKTKIDLFYGIEGANLQVDTSEQRNRLDYATFVGFFDKKWIEVVRFVNNIKVPLKITQNEWESSSIVDTESFSVRPGVYNVEVQLQDKVTDNLGVFKGQLTIPNYWKNELMLSDIFLSGPAARNNERANFKKGDIALSPHMFSAFNERETVGLYFEIYNLLYDSDDRTKFEVTWFLKEAGEDETEIEAVKSTLQYSGETRDDKIYFNLELSDTDSGDYELVIFVEDMISEAEATKRVRLTVL